MDIPEWARFRRGLCLYDYQIESVNRLCAQEAKVVPPILGRAVLTEPFGSGKTFIILGLIKKDPIPPVADKEVRLYDRLPIHYCSFGLSYPNQLIRPTAIVVSRSVYAQWVEKLSRFTAFHIFKAKDKPAVNNLIQAIMKDGTIHNYDIVLIKYGKVKNDADSVDLCKMINRATSSAVWSRAIYDDIDFIHDCACLRAISSIFITGATDFTYYSPHIGSEARNRVRIPTSTRDLLANLPRVNHVFVPEQLGFTAMHLWARCGHDPAAIAQQHGIYAMNWLRCSITNADINSASNLIGNITSVDCAELLRMMNGDAMVSAATMLRATVVTPYAMFAKVLGLQRQDYEIASARLRVLRMICEVPQDKRRIARDDESDEKTRAMTAQEMRIPEEQIAIARETSQALQHFDANAQIALPDAVLAATIADLEAYIARMDRSFERIQENLSSQICSVCCDDLAGLRIVIMRCCGYVVCSRCCVLASNFTQSRGSDGVYGICIQCRTRVDLTRDIVFIDSGINPATLIEDVRKHIANADDIAHLKDATAATAASAPEDAAAQIRTKVGYIVNLVSGAKIRETSHLKITKIEPENITGIMNGTQNVEPKRRKYLICSQFDETLDELAVALQERGISFVLLQGTVHDFEGIISHYANDRVDVMMLNVRLLYAGVDLQMTSDIIIINAGRTENIGQIIGRAQRIGRTCSLTVHMLEYVGNGCETHGTIVRGARRRRN